MVSKEVYEGGGELVPIRSLWIPLRHSTQLASALRQTTGAIYTSTGTTDPA